MAISSNTLYHFTRALDTLKLILQQRSFWPRYCEEYGWKICIAVPMTCFCDIPLSQIKNHISKYGGYGLGLTKTWGVEHGVSPVFYVTPKTVSMLNFVTKKNHVSDQERVRTVIAMIKLHSGANVNKKGEREEGYNYYDEREWRYVPDMENKKEVCVKVTRKLNLDELSKRTNDAKYRLCFDYKDIKYLFVCTEQERYDILRFIDELQMEEDDRALLKSKILTKEQIQSDL